MAAVKSALLFLLQSFVAGLAVAFLVVLVRPEGLASPGTSRVATIVTTEGALASTASA